MGPSVQARYAGMQRKRMPVSQEISTMQYGCKEDADP
jgi:hypothetical protein